MDNWNTTEAIANLYSHSYDHMNNFKGTTQFNFLVKSRNYDHVVPRSSTSLPLTAEYNSSNVYMCPMNPINPSKVRLKMMNSGICIWCISGRWKEIWQMKRREQCGLDLFCDKVGFGILAEQPEQSKPVLNEIPIWFHTNGSSGRLAHSKQCEYSILQKILYYLVSSLSPLSSSSSSIV